MAKQKRRGGVQDLEINTFFLTRAELAALYCKPLNKPLNKPQKRLKNG